MRKNVMGSTWFSKVMKNMSQILTNVTTTNGTVNPTAKLIGVTTTTNNCALKSFQNLSKIKIGSTSSLLKFNPAIISSCPTNSDVTSQCCRHLHNSTTTAKRLNLLLPPQTKPLLNVATSFTPSQRSYSDWSDLIGKDKVVFLTDKSIEGHIRSSGPLLLMFYAPWCVHCRSAKPEFAKAAYVLAQEFPSAQLAAIDCIMYPSIYEKFEVIGYPTLKYFWQGRDLGEYRYRRRAMDIVQFMLREPKTKDDV